MTGFCGSQEPGDQIAEPSFAACTVIQIVEVEPVAGPRTLATFCGFGPSGRSRHGPNCLTAVCSDRAPGTDSSVRERLGSVANRSVLHPTRLETRTKESSTRASRRLARKPAA